MLINIFLPKYNWIFQCYMCVILLFNLGIFYFYVGEINKKINISNNNKSKEIGTNYKYMFKKIIKISKNPIIFSHQLKQINKISTNNTKYEQNIIFLKNFFQSDSTFKYYKKIKKIKKILRKNNFDSEHDFMDVIARLMCINF